MTRIIGSFLVVLLLAASTWGAERHITLKHNFFTGWKYTTDGFQFHSVGMTGKSLYQEMEGNKPAQDVLKSYGSLKTWAMITGFVGGFLVGWPLGAELAGDEWEDEDTYMLAAGIPLCIVSTICEATAHSRLQRAVRVYNGEEQALQLELDYRKAPLVEAGQLRFALSLNF
jgi:hypothetical protein